MKRPKPAAWLQSLFVFWHQRHLFLLKLQTLNKGHTCLKVQLKHLCKMCSFTPRCHLNVYTGRLNFKEHVYVLLNSVYIWVRVLHSVGHLEWDCADILVLNRVHEASILCLTCLTSVHKLDAVSVLHAHCKVDLQCGQGHVCSHFTANGVAFLPDHPLMWLEWSDVNACFMCLDAFTPVFTAVHLWSDQITKGVFLIPSVKRAL